MIHRARIDHTAAGEALALDRPVGELSTSSASEVPAVLEEAERAARGGRHVAGFVCYEAAPAFDPAFPAGVADPALPLAWFGLFDQAHPDPDPDPGPDPGPRRAPGEAGPDDWQCSVDPGGFAVALDAIRERLAAGDTYLINYTTRFRRRWCDVDDPFDLYRRLVAGYGAGYHAYIETSDWAVACGSPELFFERSGDQLTTRPIKGTAARGRWAQEDLEVAAALAESAKERAENVMVVDMLRNDLGRIAATGTVSVPDLARIEQHPAMWQLTSTVRATLGSGVGLAGIFAALFPCASVTGTPKVSAMHVIAGLEPEPRGLYCGAAGYLAPSSDARFAVAIRTAVIDKANGRAEYGSGVGISWDSDTRAEWEEVHLKARALNSPAAFALGPGEGLIETMFHGPGGVRNLERHLARLAASARYFDMEVPDRLRGRVEDAMAGIEGPRRVRLVLGVDGSLTIETPELDLLPDRDVKLCVDREPVFSGDSGLFHKTTRRARYDDRSRRHPGSDDVVLINERREITETTRANIAVRLDGRWWTPPRDSGLLPGVERERLLSEGELTERVVTVADIERADGVATLSSLRGWRPAQVADACACPR